MSKLDPQGRMSIQFSEAGSHEFEEASIREVESDYESTFSVLDPGDRYSLLPLEREKNQFRLLQLLPGTSSQPIETKLYVVCRDDGPIYSALSYTWGDHTQVMPITVNGLEWFVTENLYLGLMYLRSETEALTLWVDALCIDQKNHEEKSWHVQLMRETFKEAQRTLVWLGTGSDETIVAVPMLQRIGIVGSALGSEKEIWGDEVCSAVVSGLAKAKEHSRRTEQDDDSKLSPIDRMFRDIVTQNEKGLYFPEPGTLEFFSLPWWSRIWVLQELAVSHDIEMICGHSRISGPEINVAAQIYRQYQELHWANWNREESISVCPESIIDQLNSPIAMIEQAIYAQFTCRWAQLNLSEVTGLPLAFLLSSTYAYGATRVLKASDPRDYILGLLGLSTDHTSLGVVADYSKTNAAVYIEVARALISHGFYIALSWCRSKDGSSHRSLPSWVPDLSHRIHRPFQWVVLDRTTNTFVLEPSYSASRGLSKRSRNTLDLPDLNRVLHVQGVVVDTVQTCGTSLGELYRRTSISPDSLARICIRWLRELKMTIEDYDDLDIPHRIEAIWRTSVADVEVTPSWEKFRWRGKIPEFYQEMYHLNFPYSQMVEHEALKAHYTFMDLVNIARRPFVSKTGYVGLCPDDVLPGDKIVVICGAEMPHVLRIDPEGRSTLIGDAYVHGIMDGLSGKPDIQTFELR